MEGEHTVGPIAQMRLPREGLILPNGVRFYHASQTTLKPAYLQRIAECGVVIKKGQFSKEEDETIRKNWVKYAKEYGEPLDRAFEFAGGYAQRMRESNEFAAFREKQKVTQFVPKMCEGLDDRYGKQVINRMYRLYHPSVEEVAEQGTKGWTEDDLNRLRRFMASGTPVSLISLSLKKSKDAIFTKMRKLRLLEGSSYNYDGWNAVYGSEQLCEPIVKSLTCEEKIYLYRFVDSSLEECIDGEEILESIAPKGFDDDMVIIRLTESPHLKEICERMDWPHVALLLEIPLEIVKKLWYIYSEN